MRGFDELGTTALDKVTVPSATAVRISVTCGRGPLFNKDHMITEQSFQQLPNGPDSTEGELLAQLFAQCQQGAAGLLLLFAGKHDPTDKETLDALKDVALVWRMEAERFLKENA